MKTTVTEKSGNLYASPGWEVIERSAANLTARFKVPGGWLVFTRVYRSGKGLTKIDSHDKPSIDAWTVGNAILSGDMSYSPCLCFVPDPQHQWELQPVPEKHEEAPQ